MGDFEVQNLQRSDQNRNVTHGISQVMKIIQIHPGLWKKTVDLLGLYLPNILKHMAGFSWVKTVDGRNIVRALWMVEVYGPFAFYWLRRLLDRWDGPGWPQKRSASPFIR